MAKDNHHALPPGTQTIAVPKSVARRLQNVPKAHGFATANSLPDQQVEILQKATLTSDDPEFPRIIESITSTFLARAGVIVDRVSTFLIVIHSDDSADLYLNDSLVTTMEMRPKRTMKAGEPVTSGDIVDIRKVHFAGVALQSSDRIIYCAKIGWKFGLFFDLHNEGDLSIDDVERSLGTLHRTLGFEHVYETLDAKHFDAMLADGWFPFIEILADGYPQIARGYADNFDVDGRVRKLLDSFTAGRIATMTERWWTRPAFASRRKILEAGVQAYLQGTDSGYITSIKTLATEIEGILREQHAADTGAAANLKLPVLIQHIIDKEVTRSGDGHSLTLPTPFLRYLKEVIFRGFDVTTGDVSLSRHSAGHGMAKQEAYTRARGLQLILAVDQLWFFSQ